MTLLVVEVVEELVLEVLQGSIKGLLSNIPLRYPQNFFLIYLALKGLGISSGYVNLLFLNDDLPYGLIPSLDITT